MTIHEAPERDWPLFVQIAAQPLILLVLAVCAGILGVLTLVDGILGKRETMKQNRKVKLHTFQE